ncbi:MAG: flagellar motor protein MotB [Candidatus Auribacterota bacterium]|nr:flagellar motor protein MotB [Candidatus Auribacterota bacterium]
MADESELIPQIEHERLQVESGEGAEGDWPPDWMVTYSDMTTILMTFFVLLYAFSAARVDESLLKFRETADDRIVLGRAVKTQMDRITEEELQILHQFQRLTKDQQQTVLAEMRALQMKADEVMEFVRQGKMEDAVDMKVTAEDIVIIPTAPLIFREGRATIKKSFYPILDKIAWLLKSTGASVRIEGHTDKIPIHPRHRQHYSSNWELSAARAIAVAHYLGEKEDIPMTRISTSAYGPSRPRYTGEDPERQAQNRRVEFHIYISSKDITK